MDLDPRACYRAIVTRDARFDGRLFVGVRTTGIYCRPICPARTPKREHVMFFPKAAAVQEAGFRPCLRCRPEAAPDFAAWRGTSNTVARALSLIEMGGLDEADVETLSARRVLLAKQLLRETTLPMSDVALASGFGSIRRFNETFQRLFQRPSGTLRRSGRSSSSARGAVSLQLGYKPPFDWASMLAFLRARAIAGVEVVTGDTYWRTIEVGGAHGIVAVTHGHKHAQRVRVHCPQLSALPVIIARLRRLFDLSADPQTIGAHLSEDPVLAPLLAARPGLRVPGAWDGFELAARAVLGQQISVPAAITLAGRLRSQYGDPGGPVADHVDGLTMVFPTAGRLASVSPADLPVPRARAIALVALAKTVAANPQLFRVGRTLEEVVADLRALKGIGEWTAHYIAMRELREPDAFPPGDVGLLRALTDSDGRRPAAAEVLARAERWRPWRAYAAQHLWMADATRAS
ncbi:MAG: DNA-3-methyladenine glycosylase 2 family protein [Acidimicrobiia bacterium]|nr:DNA-3-methyladenine glycosylase 2 family protein [Acidimicrobiia bacterium]